MKKIISSALAVLMCQAFVLPVWAWDFTSRVEAEWCEMTNIPVSESGENNLPVYRSSATFSNGLAVNHTNTTQIPDGGWYMSYDIVVNADGIYNLSFMTSAVGSKYTSPYSISINGGEPAEVLTGMKIADGYNANWAKYSMSTYLEKGSNTVTVEITDYTEQSKSSSPRTVFYFDYFDVEFSENQGVRAEGESYFDASATSGISAATDATANSALTGDKRYLKIGGDAVSADETKSVKVKVYAPESGEYKMNTICSKLGVGWAGKWDLSDENGNVYPMNAETVSFVRDVLPSASSAFCEYNLNTPVYLDSGYNTLTITAYTRGSGGFATFVDYIAFTKSSSGSLKIEAEACAEPGYWTASNGRLTLNQTDEVWGYDPVGDAFEVYYDFEIAEENDYHLYFDMAAANSSNNNVSRLEISVDGEKWKSFDTDNLSYYGKTSSGISSTYAPAVYMYEKSYTLTEGSHSIGMRVTEPIAPDDRRLQYYADVDKIMILPDDRRAEKAEAAIGVPYLAAGDSTELSLTILDNYANAVNADDFTVSYESDNEQVASVSADGTVTANRCGSARITVYAESDNFGSVSAEADITVISGVQGIYVTECTRSGNTVTVKLINPNQTDSNAALIVTEYEQVNGAEKLTKIHTVELLAKSGKVGDDEMRGIMEKTYTITLDSAESLSDVYFWTDSDDMVSLWNGLVGQEG